MTFQGIQDDPSSIFNWGMCGLLRWGRLKKIKIKYVKNKICPSKSKGVIKYSFDNYRVK